MNKRLICSSILIILTGLPLLAQSGTDSPYSQYGLGTLADLSQGFNRGMNGVGIGLRKGTIVNTLNPASYSAVDSLTMIFDVGLSGQITNYKEGGKSVNMKDANFEYAVGSFRLLPGVGMTFGVLPLSNIGYNYNTTTSLSLANGTITETYAGSGGIHQAFVGAGWQVLKPLSVGVNLAYLWGNYTKSVTSSSTTYVNSLVKTYSASVNSYRIGLGVQWQQALNRTDHLTVGATVDLGHKLGADAVCTIQNANTTTQNRDTTTFTVSNGLSLPMSYGVGATWEHAGKWLVGADVSMQRWGSLDYPTYDNASKGYVMVSGLLKNRYSVNVGMDYVPNEASRKSFLNRTHYRLGAGYATPYYYINGKEGPKELTVSGGFGIPLQNGWNSRGGMKPVLNVSVQWGHTAAKDFITENVFRLNIGLTFNERWFAKWKVD